MLHHGLKPLEISTLLDRKPQNDVSAVFHWYRDATPLLAQRLEKDGAQVVGDKSPDFYLQPALVNVLIEEHHLLYSIRDPRAIFRSIIMHEGSTDQEKQNRWVSLCRNYQTWEPLLDRENVLAIRYEQLVQQPQRTMQGVYSHLGVEFSDRFMTPFPRMFPSRFLWKTAVDWETGVHKDFDSDRVDLWQRTLSREQLDFVANDPVARRIMDRFGYQW